MDRFNPHIPTKSQNSFVSLSLFEGTRMQARKNIDMRSLRFFVDLLATGSLQRTGDNFAMSPATAQRTLAKLRLCFDDPLFERQGFAMMPTPKARAVAGEVRSILAAFDHAGAGEEAFEGREHRLRVTAFDNAAIAVLSRIFGPVRKRAPKLRFQVLQADERMFEQLRSDDIDFAVYARQGVPADCLSAPLVTTPYVWVVQKGHPLEKEVERKGFVAREVAVRFPQVIANAQPDRRREPTAPPKDGLRRGPNVRSRRCPSFLRPRTFLTSLPSRSFRRRRPRRCLTSGAFRCSRRSRARRSSPCGLPGPRRGIGILSTNGCGRSLRVRRRN